MQCASPRLEPFRFRAWPWSSMHCCTWQSRLLSPYAVSPNVIYEGGRLESTLPGVDKGSQSRRKCFAFRKTARRVVGCARAPGSNRQVVGNERVLQERSIEQS